MLLLSPKKRHRKNPTKTPKFFSPLITWRNTIRDFQTNAENMPVQTSRSRLLPALSERHTMKVLLSSNSRYTKSCTGSPRLALQLRSWRIQLKSELSVCVCVCAYIYIYIYTHTHTYTGARGSLVVMALRYKPAGRGFDSRWCHWNFSVT